MAINEPTPEIALHYARWAKNRAFLAGEAAVKAHGARYQPMPDKDMEASAFADHLMRIAFFPAARRTQQGYLGLMFRKRPVLDAKSEALAALADIITPEGDTHEDLAWKLASEVLATDFAGLLVDHPEAQPNLSKADAIAEGQRPFINLYLAESILEVSTALVRGRKRIVRVRLLEEAGSRVRELVLEQGIYRVLVHDFNGSAWAISSTTTPLRKGVPLQDIPFHVVSSGNTLLPQLGLLDDVINLNHNHYLHQGDLTSTYRYLSRPVPYVIGCPSPEGGWRVTPGSVLEAEAPKTEVEFGFLEYSGQGVNHLIDQRNHLEDQMAKVGARLLASDKAAAEAAETHAIRRASENATLASVANNISRSITKAFEDVSAWMDGSEVSYQINQDYLPQRVDSGELSAYVGAVQAGLISWETFFYVLRDRGAVDPTLEPEVERLRLETDAKIKEARMAKQQELMAANAVPVQANVAAQ